MDTALSDGSGFGKNVIIFGADRSSFVDVDNKNKDILILGRGATQGLDSTTLTAEKQCVINFSDRDERFCFKFAL